MRRGSDVNVAQVVVRPSVRYPVGWSYRRHCGTCLERTASNGIYQPADELAQARGPNNRFGFSFIIRLDLGLENKTFRQPKCGR